MFAPEFIWCIIALLLNLSKVSQPFCLKRALLRTLYTTLGISHVQYFLRYSCTMAARGLRGMREWRRYIDHEPSGSMNQKPRALPRKAQEKRHRTSVLYDT